MELKQLQYVMEVARWNSISKAAEALYTSQPTISHQVSQLEDELGVQLFNRTSSGVTLTVHGVRFLKYAERILEDTRKLHMAFAEEVPDLRMPIRIGLFPFHRSAGITDVLLEFFHQNPKYYGSIQVSDNDTIYEMLLDGRLDYAIIKTSPMVFREEISYLGLRDEPLYAVYNRGLPLAEKERITFRDLDGQSILLTKEGESILENLYRLYFDDESVSFTAAPIYTSDTDTLTAQIEMNYGLCIATESVAKELSARPDILASEISPRCNLTSYLVYAKSRRYHDRIQAFENYVQSALRQ